jgi:uncharacterized membrane protein YhaH (DUF805 family)
MMLFMDYFAYCLMQYFTFRGRSDRKEFWTYMLVLLSFGLLAMVFDKTIDDVVFGPIASVYFIVMMMPTISVSVRRMHDIGLRGAVLLLVLIPVIGLIYILFLASCPGEKGKNEYGPDPTLDNDYLES